MLYWLNIIETVWNLQQKSRNGYLLRKVEYSFNHIDSLFEVYKVREKFSLSVFNL